MNRRQLTWPSGEAVVVAEGQEQIAAAGGAGAGAGACVTGGGGLDAATTAAGWQRFVDAATGAPHHHPAIVGTFSEPSRKLLGAFQVRRTTTTRLPARRAGGAADFREASRKVHISLP